MANLPQTHRDPLQPTDWFNDIFSNDLFNRGFLRNLATWAPAETPEGGVQRWMPSVNLSETTKKYTLTAEIPGIDPKDVEITMEGDTLTVRGEKQEEEKSTDDKIHRVERRYGSFMRSVTFPNHVDAEHVKATTKDGVLTITVNKITPEEPRRINVKPS